MSRSVSWSSGRSTSVAMGAPADDVVDEALVIVILTTDVEEDAVEEVVT